MTAANYWSLLMSTGVVTLVTSGGPTVLAASATNTTGEGFTIPAGESAHTETSSFLMNGELPNLKIWSTFPHMHLLGTGFKYWIDKKNGDEQCLLDSSRWDFHNQLTYTFLEPVSLRQGDEIHFSCTWDNSASNPNQLTVPPVDVTYGDGTNDEMCFVFSYVTICRSAGSEPVVE